MKKGPGTNEEQVLRLREKVRDDGIKEADSIVSQFSSEVIALAYKITRISASRDKLPANVNKMLGNLSEEDAEKARKLLVGAKVSTSC